MYGYQSVVSLRNVGCVDDITSKISTENREILMSYFSLTVLHIFLDWKRKIAFDLLQLCETERVICSFDYMHSQ